MPIWSRISSRARSLDFLSVLSFGGSRLTDPRALRLIVWSCIAFHVSSGVLEPDQQESSWK
jgi:hypothetical protein